MKKFLTLILMSIFVLTLAACGGNDESEATESDDAKEVEEVVVEHDLGETTVKKNPERVVAFDFGSLDTLDKLDIDVAAVPQQNIPGYLEKYEGDDYENVGALKEPDFEKLSEIDPQLIIISGRQADLYDQLSEIAPTVFLGVDTTDYMNSFEKNVGVIGEIFDKEAEAQTELDAIKEQIDATAKKAEEADKSGLIILANDDKISAYGPSSRFGLIHDVFGVKPIDEDIEASTHGMNVTFEYVSEQDPDILYVVDRGAAIGEESSAKVVVENKLMEKTKAYKEDNIVYLNPEYWYLSGGGLESVAEMVKEIDESL